jgi:hypothetical protein
LTVFPEIDELRGRVAKLEKKLAVLEQVGVAAAASTALPSGYGCRSIRKRSEIELFGIPLWEIAMGPGLERGERIGHAKAIFALGDMATGLFAMGGIAFGGVTFGGLSFGLIAVGGVALGVLAAAGGAAVGFGLSVGGMAIGTVAIGGMAIGLFPIGGLAITPNGVNLPGFPR